MKKFLMLVVTSTALYGAVVAFTSCLVIVAVQAVASDCCTPPRAPVNRLCPISGNAAVSGTTVWQGKRVAFCCPCCARQWDELTDDEKAEKLDQVKQIDAQRRQD